MMLRQSPLTRAVTAALIVLAIGCAAGCGIKGPLRPAPKAAATPPPPPTDNPAVPPPMTSPALPPPTSAPADRLP